MQPCNYIKPDPYLSPTSSSNSRPNLTYKYFPNGASLKYYTVRDLRNGPAEFISPDGAFATANYLHNFLHGLLNYVGNNYTISITFNAGLKHGPATFIRHGEYRLECTFNCDKLHGMAKKTYDTGRIVFIRWNQGICKGHIDILTEEEIAKQTIKKIDDKHEDVISFHSNFVNLIDKGFI